jgi:hypothetical protein
MNKSLVLEEFGEGKGQTAWIGSLVPGVTLLVGKLHVVIHSYIFLDGFNFTNFK